MIVPGTIDQSLLHALELYPQLSCLFAVHPQIVPWEEQISGMKKMDSMNAVRTGCDNFQLKDIPDNKLVGPVPAPDFDLFLMKCGQKVMSVLPDKELIRTELEAVKMEDMSKEMFETVRENYLIEMKD